jgi:hypothetical protein
MTSTGFSYIAYGLSIHAAMPLPELTARETEGEEISIRFGHVMGDSSLERTVDEGWDYFSPAPGEVRLFWRGVGSFSVRGGREVVVDPSPGLDDEGVLRLFILGPVLAVLLGQRGHLLLHASAVTVGSGAVLFLGEAARGKSTTAAALHARGHALVTDDIAVLRVEEGGRPLLFPGFPQLKLWPEALVSLGENPGELPRCNPRFEKRARRAARGFSSTPLPVERIYVLEETGEAPAEIVPLQPQEALTELLRHTYGAMGVGSASHFRGCVSVANRAGVCSLRRQKSLRRLPELARLVENDLARDSEEERGGASGGSG